MYVRMQRSKKLNEYNEYRLKDTGTEMSVIIFYAHSKTRKQPLIVQIRASIFILGILNPFTQCFTIKHLILWSIIRNNKCKIYYSNSLQI